MKKLLLIGLFSLLFLLFNSIDTSAYHLGYSYPGSGFQAGFGFQGFLGFGFPRYGYSYSFPAYLSIAPYNYGRDMAALQFLDNNVIKQYPYNSNRYSYGSYRSSRYLY